MSDETPNDDGLITELKLKPVRDLQKIRSFPFDRALKFNQIIVTGPPTAGKSSLVRGIGGWSEEGFIDLSIKGWWRAPNLALRPREVHLLLPFVGRSSAMPLYHEDWLAHWRDLQLDLSRILIPPAARYFFSVNWRSRFAFVFLLPPAEELIRRNQERAKLGTHPIDESMGPEQLRRQLEIYTQVALHMHRQGMIVYVRTDDASPPARILDTPEDSSHGQS